MTESQKAFEAHYKDFYDMPDAVFPKHSKGTYVYQSHYVEFKQWQAAEAYGRKAALEEAYAIYESAQELSNIKDGLRELIK